MRLPRKKLAGACAVLAAGVVCAAFAGKRSASAAPHIPASEAAVLCSVSPAHNDLAALRSRLEANPADVGLATELARRNIEMARASADPRYLGHAQAALAPWRDSVSPPPDVLLLRATIRQSVHEFEPALDDLEQLLRMAPRNAQAWLTRAVIQMVRGDYEGSRASCAPLERLAGELVWTQCTAAVDSLSGRAEEAYSELRAAHQRAGAVPAEERAWVLSSLGEIAVRAGRDGDAEKDYLAALSLSPSDGYTRAAYADLLLDLHRAPEALPWLRGHENDDNLLLRLAMAEKAAGVAECAAHVETLRSRYLASQERGDVVHRREQARFHLVLLGDAESALALAKANWQVQREPADARILLESAIAAHQPEAAAPVVAFLAEHRAQEPRLVALASVASATGDRP